MKKRFLLWVMLLPAVLHAQLTDRLTVNPDEIKFEKQGQFDRIIYGTDYLREPGKPELPVVFRSFVIPTDAEVTGMEVEITGERRLEGLYYLYPVQPPQIAGGQTTSFVETDSTYRSTTLFPGNAAYLSFDGIVQGYHVVTISYYPVGYLPLARELYFRDLSVTVNYQTGSGNSVQQAKSSYNRAMLSKAYVKSMVQNPADVELYYDESVVVPPSTVMDRFGGSSKGRRIDAIGETVPDYVIITCDSLKDSFKRLADWKTKKGVPTIIKSVEEIGKSYSGSNLVEKIRNYLIDVKKRWSGNGLFVLLGGDTNIIPARMVKGWYESLYPADCYFIADKVDEWNAETFSFNENYTTSSFLGRLPLQNNKEVTIFIEKLLSYEKANTVGGDYSYLNNSLIIDAFSGFSKNKETNRLEYHWGQMNSLFGYCQNRDKNHNYWYLFDHVGCTNPLHVHSGSGNYDTKQAEELSKSSFLLAWHNGKAFGKFHFIYHIDHSMQANMGVSQQDKGDYITNEDVDNMPDDRYPKVIFSSGCHPARFSKDCMAEHFLKKTYGGAVAFIGNTDVGFFDETPQLFFFLDAAFNKTAKNVNQFSIGYLYRQTFRHPSNPNWRLHLLGDPEMPVWTAAPKQLQVITTPQVISNTESLITVRVANLPAGQQARICLMKGEEGYATLNVSDTKEYKFTFTPMTPGEVSVTVTAHNFRPYEGSIPVMVSTNSSVKLSQLIFLDGATPLTDGNRDGQLDAGETVELIVKLKNLGRVATEVPFAKLYCNRPELITILDDEISFGVIAPGAELSGAAKFRFKVNRDIGGTEILKNDSNNVRFIFDSFSEAGYYTDSFNVNIFTAKPELLGQLIKPDALTPGINEVVIKLTNTGKSVMTGLKGVLIPDEDGSMVASCPDNTTTFPDIPPGETVQNTSVLRFLQKAGYKPGDPLKMKLMLTNEHWNTWEMPLDPADTPAKVDVNGMSVQSNGFGVRVCWSKTNKATSYNVYRNQADIPRSYIKVNDRPLLSTYFQDEDYQPLKTYFYKVEAVSASGNTGERSDAIRTMTPGLLAEGFPRTTTQRCSAAGLIVEDVDNDGYKNIVITGNSVGESKKGFITILNHKGEELFNEESESIDRLGEMVTSVTASPSVGNLLGDGYRQIVTTTQNDTFDGNTVDCFLPENTGNNKQADRMWQNVIGKGMFRGAVLANLDNSADGSMESLIRSNSDGSTLKVLDNRGRLKNTFGSSGRYSYPAVADLDGDGDLEIIVCYENREEGGIKGMYIWHHDGTPYGKNPYWGEGISLCSPVICDWDGRGKVALVAETMALNSRIFAIRLSGTFGIPVSTQWGGNLTIPYSNMLASGLDHMLSVGDINGDGKPEVVALGIETIRAWDMAGNQLFSTKEPQLFKNAEWQINIQAPILADMDGDGIADIVFNSFDRICALHADGTRVDGFPLYTNMTVQEHVCVADIDYDGKNELIAMDTDAQVFMWKTRGKSSAIQWGSERHDPQNTGEYRPVCESVVITDNTTWNGISPCGNVIVRSGKFIIPSGRNLSLDKHSILVVRTGATLEIDGGTLSNANVLIATGGKLILKNGGTILLRNTAKVKVERGGLFSNLNGKIK